MLTVHVVRNTGGMTNDMGYWFIFAGFPKTMLPQNGVAIDAEVVSHEGNTAAVIEGPFSWAEVQAEYGNLNEPGIIHSGFANTAVSEINTADEAISLAMNEHRMSIDESCSVFYDNGADVWQVYFYVPNAAGGDCAVYINGEGITLLIVAGE